MGKTIFFIGDDHDTDGWITTGWKSVSQSIGKAPFVLLLEVPFDAKNGITAEDLDTILEDKPEGEDATTLKAVWHASYKAYGFDAEGGPTSTKRQDGQAKNINFFVNSFSETKSQTYFVVIVGDYHLQPEGWTPLQDYDYGHDVTTVYAPTP